MPRPSHPQVDVLVGGPRSQGAYAVLDLRLPGGLVVPRHVRRGHSAVAEVLEGAVEIREDGHEPVIVRGGLIVLADGRPLAARVLEAARLVALLVPAVAAELLPAALAPDVLPDDRAALLAAVGIRVLPGL